MCEVPAIADDLNQRPLDQKNTRLDELSSYRRLPEEKVTERSRFVIVGRWYRTYDTSNAATGTRGATSPDFEGTHRVGVWKVSGDHQRRRGVRPAFSGTLTLDSNFIPIENSARVAPSIGRRIPSKTPRARWLPVSPLTEREFTYVRSVRALGAGNGPTSLFL